MLPLVRFAQCRVEGRRLLARIRRNEAEDAGGHVGDIVEAHLVEIDAGVALESVHHRVAEGALVAEVPKDGALVHLRAFGDRADGEPLPVANRRTVQQLGRRRDDALTRLLGTFTTECAVVGAAGAGRRARGHGRVTGRVSQPRTVEVGASLARSRSTSHSGKRLSTSSIATRPSMRASAAPRQKWMP